MAEGVPETAGGMQHRGAAGSPDVAGETVGWRIWDVVRDDDQLRLSSLLYRAIWEPGVEAAARCRRSLAFLPWERMPLHQPPAVDCCCGLYGTARLSTARAFDAFPSRTPVPFRVLGRVALWGRVIEGDAGWRAEFGYPVDLFVAPDARLARGRLRRRALRASDVAHALADYAVPVTVGTPRDGAVPQPR